MKKPNQPKRVIIIVLSILLVSLIFSFWLLSQKPVISVSSSSEDWPMFHRDLTHTGHSNSLAPLTADILWKFDGGHVIWASPAVVNGHVFIASDDTKIYCLDALTGEQVWRYRTKNAIGSSTAVAGGHVYVGSYDHNIYCLDASTGAKIWSWFNSMTLWKRCKCVVLLVYEICYTFYGFSEGVFKLVLMKSPMGRCVTLCAYGVSEHFPLDLQCERS